MMLHHVASAFSIDLELKADGLNTQEHCNAFLDWLQQECDVRRSEGNNIVKCILSKCETLFGATCSEFTL